MTDLPNWVYDLITAVKRFEYVHPKIDDCLSDALDAVPEWARREAEVIDNYKLHQDATTREPGRGGTCG